MVKYVTELFQEDGAWVVEVQTPAGMSLEYRYSSERQARYFAAVFSLGPSTLPTPLRVRTTPERSELRWAC